jgi:hypothetical protein
MLNGHDLTNSSQQREDLGNIKSGDTFIHLGYTGAMNGWATKQLASFRLAHGRGFPYLAPVSYLTAETWNGFPQKPWEVIPHDPPMTPQERQAQNLNRTPVKGINIGYGELVMVAVAIAGLLLISIHLRIQAEIGR